MHQYAGAAKTFDDLRGHVARADRAPRGQNQHVVLGKCFLRSACQGRVLVRKDARQAWLMSASADKRSQRVLVDVADLARAWLTLWIDQLIAA